MSFGLGMQTSGSNQALGDFHSPAPSPLPHSYTSAGHHQVAICQSNTMPTLSSLHATGQFTAPSSNSVAYSMSAHNPTSYSNPVSAYSTNSYGLPNTHQVTFTNPVTAPLVNNIGQISSTLAGLQSNLQNITGNVSGISLGGGLTGSTLTGTMAGTGLTSCLNNVQTSLSGGLTSTLGGLQSTLTGGLGNALSNLTTATQLGGLNTSLSGTNVYGGGTGTYTNPLLSSGLGTNTMNIKLKPLEEIDLGMGRYGTNTSGVGRVATPVTPHQPSWALGLDSQFGTDRLGALDSGFSHDRNQRALSRIMPNSGLEMDSKFLLHCIIRKTQGNIYINFHIFCFSSKHALYEWNSPDPRRSSRHAGHPWKRSLLCIHRTVFVRPTRVSYFHTFNCITRSFSS